LSVSLRTPGFWNDPDGSWQATLLAPVSALVATATARRVARPGWQAPVPVLCCGNAGVGGAGKTTVALDLGRRLIARGRQVAFLTRGYGGRAGGTVRVRAGEDGVARVGDEALLLAGVAPTFVDADRAAAARAAIADGADVLVMDDGLQNPGLARTLSFLVVDGAVGFGNRRVMPAGPLREPVRAAAARCGACVVIGNDLTGAMGHLPPGMPVLRAMLRSEFAPSIAGGRPMLAFAGIARPDKFFESLEAAGAAIAARRAFPDHHIYRDGELRGLLAEAARLGAVPVTTPKDAVRLAPPFAGQVRAIGVTLVWDEPAAIDMLLDRALAA
jgi:tetraacyldisaccharide 4'-kinase